MHNGFAFFYYPDGSREGSTIVVDVEEYVIPLLKEWLCISKDRFFNDVFHHVRTRYYEEKNLG